MTVLGNSTVVITGGASGIGRRTAEGMARRGASVVVWDLDAARARETAEMLRGAGAPRAEGFACDVTDRDAVFAAARETVDAVGSVDVLFNNAGVVSGKWLTDLTEQDVRRTFAVNTIALFWTTQAFLPAMIERDRGHFVTMASASAIVGVAKLTDYSASKWAAMGFDESLRVELRRRKSAVRTTVVCPFYVDTGMFRGVKTRFSWILPILHEDDVARRIVQAVEQDKRRLYMPPVIGLGHILRFLPVSAFDRFNDELGVNRSMDDFAGRGGH